MRSAKNVMVLSPEQWDRMENTKAERNRACGNAPAGKKLQPRRKQSATVQLLRETQT